MVVRLAQLLLSAITTSRSRLAAERQRIRLPRQLDGRHALGRPFPVAPPGRNLGRRPGARVSRPAAGGVVGAA